MDYLFLALIYFSWKSLPICVLLLKSLYFLSKHCTILTRVFWKRRRSPSSLQFLFLFFLLIRVCSSNISWFFFPVSSTLLFLLALQSEFLNLVVLKHQFYCKLFHLNFVNIHDILNLPVHFNQLVYLLIALVSHIREIFLSLAALTLTICLLLFFDDRHPFLLFLSQLFNDLSFFLGQCGF